MAVCEPEGGSRGDCCCEARPWFSGALLDPGTTSFSPADVTMLIRPTLSRVFSRRAPTPRFSGSFGVQPLNVNSRGVDGWLAAISFRLCAINACCCSLMLIVSRTVLSWSSSIVLKSKPKTTGEGIGWSPPSSRPRASRDAAKPMGLIGARLAARPLPVGCDSRGGELPLPFFELGESPLWRALRALPPPPVRLRFSARGWSSSALSVSLVPATVAFSQAVVVLESTGSAVPLTHSSSRSRPLPFLRSSRSSPDLGTDGDWLRGLGGVVLGGGSRSDEVLWIRVVGEAAKETRSWGNGRRGEMEGSG